jgi:hypothetical protein
MKHKTLLVSLSLAIMVIAASCSGGDSPITTTPIPDLPVLEFKPRPDTAGVGYDSVAVRWGTYPRPARGELVCGSVIVRADSVTLSHIAVLRGLKVGTSYDCEVRAQEDGSSAVLRSGIIIQTRQDPCVDPRAPMARIEMVYNFPPDVPPHNGYIEVVGYTCGNGQWPGEVVYAAPHMPGGTVRAEWGVVINQPFGSTEHVVCARRAGGYILQGSDFTVKVVGGSGPPINLARSVVRQPWSHLPAMDCWKLWVSREAVRP